MKDKDLKILQDFSVQFWFFLDSSHPLFLKLPKKISHSISFDDGSFSGKTNIPDFVHIENVLMRMRIFRLNDSSFSFKRILNILKRSLDIECRNIAERISKNDKIISEKQNSIHLTINDHEYKTISHIAEYLLHGYLLHDDIEKKRHYNNLFKGKSFIANILYGDLIEWILQNTKLFTDADFLIQKYFLNPEIDFEKYNEQLQQKFKYI